MSSMLRPLARYADFTGRASRSEYWLFCLFQMLVYIVLFIAIGIMIAAAAKNPVAIGLAMLAGFGIIGLFYLACIIPQLAVTVRRLHDTNRSAWWMLLYMPGIVSVSTNVMAITSFIESSKGGTQDPAALAQMTQGSALSLLAMGCNLTMFVFSVLKGSAGPNRFGDDPKSRGFDLSVFDAPQDAPSKPEANEPYKPIFDFTSPETQISAQAVMASVSPITPRPAPPPYNPLAPVKPFGRRNLT